MCLSVCLSVCLSLNYINIPAVSATDAWTFDSKIHIVLVVENRHLTCFLSLVSFRIVSAKAIISSVSPMY